MLGPMQRPASSWKSTILDLPAKEGSMMPNIADIIRHHVSLEVRCIDRLYLHAYMPKLQTSGGLCYFLRDYLGNPIPSSAMITAPSQRTRRTQPVDADARCPDTLGRDRPVPRSHRVRMVDRDVLRSATLSPCSVRISSSSGGFLFENPTLRNSRRCRAWICFYLALVSETS
jgi:hypothetical protein